MSDEIVSLSGEWTIQEIAGHREALLAQIESGHACFDLSAVTDIDSAGLQVLVAARRTLAAMGKELHLVQASACVRAMLQTYGLDLTLHHAHEEPIT